MPTRILRGVDRHPGLLILDTGPIRELVLFHAVSEYRFEKLRGSLEFIKHQDSYKRCSKFVASFRAVTTSASVVVELYHWIRMTDRDGQAKLWRRVYEEFTSMNMGEEVVRFLEMNVDLVSRFGPVDCSMLGLAQRHVNQNPLVLTSDDPLCGECRKAGFQVSHIREIALSDQ